MNLALLVLFSAAITMVFTRGTIFDFARARGPTLWRDLAGCPLCSGVWIGGTVAALRDHTWSFWNVFAVLGLGCVTGCAALLFALAVDFLGSHATLADEKAAALRRQR
jgi:hypothetical protein